MKNLPGRNVGAVETFPKDVRSRVGLDGQGGLQLYYTGHVLLYSNIRVCLEYILNHAVGASLSNSGSRVDIALTFLTVVPSCHFCDSTEKAAHNWFVKFVNYESGMLKPRNAGL